MVIKTCMVSYYKKHKSTRGIGGTTLIGVGVGLAVLETTILLVVGSIIAGIGLGIVIIAILSDTKI